MKSRPLGGRYHPLPIEFGTMKPVKARSWPWLSGKSPYNVFRNPNAAIQGKLVFKAHRLMHHSTLGSRAIKKKRRRMMPCSYGRQYRRDIRRVVTCTSPCQARGKAQQPAEDASSPRKVARRLWLRKTVLLFFFITLEPRVR